MNNSEDTPMKVLKTATCKTLTGKATLTYQIGLSPESVVHLRISKNSGGGFFSDEWISYDEIQTALDKRPEGSDVSSYLIIPLFKGKSVNTPSFLLAVLKHLKLIETLKGKKRLHAPSDPRPFLDQVEKLITSAGGAKARGSTGATATKKAAVRKKRAAVRKAAIKKKAASRRKTGE